MDGGRVVGGLSDALRLTIVFGSPTELCAALLPILLRTGLAAKSCVEPEGAEGEEGGEETEGNEFERPFMVVGGEENH